MKKFAGDIIISHVYHIMYGSWDTEWDRQTEIKIFEKKKKEKKKSLEILFFYTYMCTINEDHMIYVLPEIYDATDRNFCHFEPFFALSSPLTTQKIKILKLKKAPWDNIILHICIINDNHMMYGSWLQQKILSFWTTFYPFTPL